MCTTKSATSPASKACTAERASFALASCVSLNAMIRTAGLRLRGRMELSNLGLGRNLSVGATFEGGGVFYILPDMMPLSKALPGFSASR